MELSSVDMEEAMMDLAVEHRDNHNGDRSLTTLAQ